MAQNLEIKWTQLKNGDKIKNYDNATVINGVQ